MRRRKVKAVITRRHGHLVPAPGTVRVILLALAVAVTALAGCGAETTTSTETSPGSPGTASPTTTTTTTPEATTATTEPPPPTTTGPVTAGPVRTPDDVTALVAEAIGKVDPGTYAGLSFTPVGSVIQPSLMGWQIEHLRFDPAFSDCRQAGSLQLVCSLTYGEEYWYSVVLGHNITGSVTVQVSDQGTFAITAWPFPEEVKTVERELRDWIRATHPEDESRMFGNDAYGVFSFTEEAARLHAERLDEFVTSRDT